MARVTEPHPQPARQPNLVLIGYRATGKTSVGARLAEALHRPFVDLDQVLVREAGRSVAEIVAQGGWAEFRRLEKALVARYRDARGRFWPPAAASSWTRTMWRPSGKTASSSG